MGSYNGVEGSYNAKLDASTGRGEFVQHSGGVGKTRVYDLVGDATGDLYMVGYTQSSVVQWGSGSLKTKIIEEGVDQDDDVGTAFQFGKQSTQLGEYQFFAVKLGAEASKTESPSCLETCGATNPPTIRSNSCFIDGVCYPTGESAEIFGRNCLVCDPSRSQTGWSYGEDVGVHSCFIDNVCHGEGEMYSYRKSRSEIIESECQVCEPSANYAAWSVKPGLQLASGLDIEPPSDCLAVASGSSNNLRPSAAPVSAPLVATTPVSNPPNTRPVVATTTDEGFAIITRANKSGLPNGAKIGIGISVTLVLILAALVTARYWARKGTGIEKDTESDEGNQDPQEQDLEAVFVN